MREGGREVIADGVERGRRALEQLARGALGGRHVDLREGGADDAGDAAVQRRLQRPAPAEIVARGNQVQRAAHGGDANHRARVQHLQQVVAREAGEAAPQPDERRPRQLGLQTGEPLDGGDRCHRLAGQQELAREQGSIELTLREQTVRRSRQPYCFFPVNVPESWPPAMLTVPFIVPPSTVPA